MEEGYLPDTVDLINEHQRLLSRHKEFLIVSEKAQEVVTKLNNVACCSHVDHHKVLVYVEELKILYEQMGSLSGDNE